MKVAATADSEYRRFLVLLKRRRLNVSRLAAQCDMDRAALNLVLLGRRPGHPTWEKLKHALTAAEWGVIRPFAERAYAKLLNAGEVRPSGFISNGVLKTAAKD